MDIPLSKVRSPVDETQAFLRSGDVKIVDGRRLDKKTSLQEYRELLALVMSQSNVSAEQRARLADFRTEHDISELDHIAALSDLSLTEKQFEHKCKCGSPSRISHTAPEQVPSSPSSQVPVKIEHGILSTLVLWCSLITGAYLGLFIRIGTSYLDSQTLGGVSSSVLYANVLGSIVMGFVTVHEKYLQQSRTHHILYLAITSGFCGSLTSFSALNVEPAKFVVRQLDGMSMTAEHGNFVWQWLLYLWAGVIVPLAALRFGQHLALMSPCKNPPTEHKASYIWAEVLLLLLFAGSTVVVVLVPLQQTPPRKYLMYAALMGAAGALLRYFLSTCLNPRQPAFPLGTFVANIIGTAVMVMITVLSKFTVHPADFETLAIYFGIMTGFCGCLTTISSFVNELHKLGIARVRNAYVYGLASICTAQLIVLLIFCLVAFAQVPSYLWQSPPHINFCAAYNSTCSHALQMVGCPPEAMVNTGCAETHPEDPARGMLSYVGDCRCGDWDVGFRVSENLLDGQIRQNVTRTMVSVWPIDSRSVPTHTYDLCASFDMACEDLLNRIECPVEMQTRDGCAGLSIASFRGVCACGKMMTGSVRVAELNLDTSLNNKIQDLAKWTRYSNSPKINFCEAYLDVCLKVMGHFQCPDVWRHITACQNMSDMSTFVGECACGDTYIFPSDRVNEIVVDTQAKTFTLYTLQRYQSANDMPAGFQYSPNGELPFDMCTSFDRACSDLLDRIDCPQELRSKLACNTTLLEWVGLCGCGGNDEIPGGRITELLMDAGISYDLIPFLYDLPLSNPYQNIIASDFFKPLQVYTNVHYGKGYEPNLDETPWLTGIPYPSA